jgi:phospholipid/cholesterol/gamma-HCH transport system substrate-binding protein
MPSYRRNVLVGLTVLGGLVVFGWMILTFSKNTAQVFAPPQIPVHFHTTRADGLSDGSEVRFLGVEVGRVEKLTRDSDGAGVTIDATVDRDPPLPANLRAQIITASALGGTSLINLDVNGEKAQGALGPDAKIRADYVGLQLNLIPPSIAQTADQVGQLSEELRKTVKQLRESGTIGDLDTTVKSINAQALKIGDFFDSLQNVFGDKKTQTDLKTAITNLRATTDKLSTVADSIQKTSDSANVTIKSTQKDIDVLSKQIGDRLVQIAGALDSVQSIMQKVDKGQGTAGQLINDPRLYQSLVDTVRQLNSTVNDLKRLVDQWEQEGVDLHLK